MHDDPSITDRRRALPPCGTPPDPVTSFQIERKEHIRALARDDELRRLSLQWMMRASHHKYTYNFSWLGRPVIQFPQDLIAVQEIIWRTRPDLIIETGIAHGGSLLFCASILELIGAGGRVLGVDIDIRPHNRSAIVEHPLARRVMMIEGPSLDRDVLARVRSIADTHQRVMVLLDSDHSHDHVLGELKAYGPLVSPGCYLVVFDTIIEHLPAGFLNDPRWDRGDSPKTAVHEFLKTNDRFEIDRAIPATLMITTAPDGYLKCVKE
jgi:cephalosporin hydroxylase